jgi:hypothetical protein
MKIHEKINCWDCTYQTVKNINNYGDITGMDTRIGYPTIAEFR